MMHFDPLPQIERTDPIIQSYLKLPTQHQQAYPSFQLGKINSKAHTVTPLKLCNPSKNARESTNRNMGEDRTAEKITMATLSLFPPPDRRHSIDPLNKPYPHRSPRTSSCVSKTTKPSQGPGPRLIGLLFADWYPAKRNVHFAMGRVEAPFTTMYRAVVTRITSDAAQLDQEIPLYVWGRFFRTEMEKGTKEFKEMRRYGFLPMEEHCRRFGGSFTVWLHLWHGMVKGLAGPGDLVTTVCRWTDLVASVRK
ncbi:hypothetical protein BC829DRAFT_390755 [Chytridium lagenaria]|nr:hypothetical protein BC829DRAFT_390755 [Chytridium lagenaria]